MSVPYAGATTGIRAREEISKILRHFGCESIGYMDDFEQHEVLLAFKHRASDCFAAARFCPSEAEIAEEYAIAAGEELTRVRAAFVAANATPPSDKTNASKDAVAATAANRSPRRQRKPSIATLVKRAEKTGKTVTSITTPDGTTINFSQEPGEANNPWLADIAKATKQ
jgi:hypothetical protein